MPGESQAKTGRRDKTMNYITALTATLGSNKFEAAYTALKNDETIDAEAMRKLAQEFTHCSYRNANTRNRALGAIWQRHRNLLSASYRAAANGGRLAG